MATQLRDKLGDSNPDYPRVLVVDDDPSFGKIMSRIAEQSNVTMTVCRTSSEVSLLNGEKFDAAIVDYDLGDDSGLDVVQQMDKWTDFPVVLVSQSQHVESPISRWPKRIVGFLQKSIGHFAILEAALAAHEMTVAERHL